MFSSEIRNTNVLCSSFEKLAVCFTIIRPLAVTTRVSINNAREDLFLKGIFTTVQQIELTW